jgi:hypothetical protein
VTAIETGESHHGRRAAAAGLSTAVDDIRRTVYPDCEHVFDRPRDLWRQRC